LAAAYDLKERLYKVYDVETKEPVKTKASSNPSAILISRRNFNASA